MKTQHLQPLGDGDHVVGFIAVVVLVVGLIWLFIVRDGGPSESRVSESPVAADTNAGGSQARP